MTDDLVQRLKGHSEIMERDKGKFVRFIDVATCTEAAERIEALEAEIEQLQVDYNELLLEVSKLRAALKNHSYTGKGWRAFKETYEALREKNDD